MRIRAKILIKNYELEERRLAKGYTQADMAELVGININRYAKLENIKAKPNEEEAMGRYNADASSPWEEHVHFARC